ncbi:MAG: hypothetical protein ACMG6E_05230, partial [Candidatus Roizmanbacteria bacterium]
MALAVSERLGRVRDILRLPSFLRERISDEILLEECINLFGLYDDVKEGHPQALRGLDIVYHEARDNSSGLAVKILHLGDAILQARPKQEFGIDFALMPT